jgi:hypothetical protein
MKHFLLFIHTNIFTLKYVCLHKKVFTYFVCEVSLPVFKEMVGVDRNQFPFLYDFSKWMAKIKGSYHKKDIFSRSVKWNRDFFHVSWWFSKFWCSMNWYWFYTKSFQKPSSETLQLRFRWYLAKGGRGRDLAEWLERMKANAVVATVPVRSQHPSTQWNLKGRRWRSVE